MKCQKRTQTIIASQNLNHSRWEELLSKLDNFDSGVRSERTAENKSVNIASTKVKEDLTMA